MAELEVVIIQQLATEDTNHYLSQCSVLTTCLNAEIHCFGIAYLTPYSYILIYRLYI